MACVSRPFAAAQPAARHQPRRSPPAPPARAALAPVALDGGAASTSAAGSATSTPTSDTLRSISVTRPKSRSMRMSDSASTPKPAIAVDARGGHGGAGAPVGCGAAPRPCRSPASTLLAVALGEQHAELGRDRDHERAQRDRHRVQRHAHGEQDQRRPAGGEHDRRRAARARGGDRRGTPPAARARPAARPTSSVSRRRHGSATCAPERAASTGSPTSFALTPAGGCSVERIASISRCWRSRLIRRIPNASVAARRSGVITSCEKYGGIAPSSAVDLRGLRESSAGVRGGLPGLEQVGQRERGAQPRLAAAPRRRCSRSA